MGAVTVDVPDELLVRLDTECKSLGVTRQERIVQALECNVAPAKNLKAGWVPERLEALMGFLRKTPGVTWCAGSGPDQPRWWVKLAIDIESEFAWHVIQELGFVLNYLSLNDRLPTVFMPVSPPPYANGGPKEFLSWAIEAEIPFLDPQVVHQMLEGRLPRPVEDPAQWRHVDEDE